MPFGPLASGRETSDVCCLRMLCTQRSFSSETPDVLEASRASGQARRDVNSQAAIESSEAFLVLVHIHTWYDTTLKLFLLSVLIFTSPRMLLATKQKEGAKHGRLRSCILRIILLRTRYTILCQLLD